MSIKQITLVLKQARGESWPEFVLHPGSVLTSSTEESADIRITCHDVMAPVGEIAINYVHKSQIETVLAPTGMILRDQHISVANILVDGIALDLELVRRLSGYLPQYRSDFVNYCCDNSIPIDFGPLQTLNFYHAGTWSMTWHGYFWAWYQQQRDLIKTQYHDIKKNADFMGDDRNNIRKQLDAFREKFFADL